MVIYGPIDVIGGYPSASRGWCKALIELYKEKYGDTDESATIRDTLIEIWNEINV